MLQSAFGFAGCRAGGAPGGRMGLFAVAAGAAGGDGGLGGGGESILVGLLLMVTPTYT